MTRKPALNLGFQFVAQRYDDNPEVAKKAGPAFLPPKPPKNRRGPARMDLGFTYHE